MFFCHRKTCNVLFTVACIIVVAFMVGYWLYKFKVEDRDIGVVDYVPLKDAKEIKFPLVSWCLKDPFIEEKLKEKIQVLPARHIVSILKEKFLIKAMNKLLIQM